MPQTWWLSSSVQHWLQAGRAAWRPVPSWACQTSATQAPPQLVPQQVGACLSTCSVAHYIAGNSFGLSSRHGCLMPPEQRRAHPVRCSGVTPALMQALSQACMASVSSSACCACVQGVLQGARCAHAARWLQGRSGHVRASSKGVIWRQSPAEDSMCHTHAVLDTAPCVQDILHCTF